MSAIDTALEWMNSRKGKVHYSMTARLGPNSYDYSSAVYLALKHAGLIPAGESVGNTDTLFGTLERAGWTKVARDHTGGYPARRGDIFIWGVRGASSGAAGHTGFFLDDHDTIIHCNYGYNGISVNPHDTIWVANGSPAVTIYRPPASALGQATSQGDDVYRQVKTAFNDALNRSFVRQGESAKQIFGDARLKYREVFEWLTQQYLCVEKLVEECERLQTQLHTQNMQLLEHSIKRYDEVWAGIFTQHSLTGNPADAQPGILPILEPMVKK
ncbi:MAG: peptidoglycan amidohydrolase family protein [Rothia sp. (in: high G+C Gram-positive bacteria)]|uniref:peptidoglycan amidohydrolase family protein n=1 Tax=Rothia sp. (in: high G+C Gram-positive bacteria) TaxID=1885016 RepID=UPI0026E0342E|nr:peptidoglycan amidohydrolase family protein [Rothia sp. (in: high G+C Gram-positive bacteria)]MDO5749644.1 peptidoglycan amidohydrolase family protein [Rothia sp. (in: high G+C Gram-positive bacteria)]